MTHMNDKNVWNFRLSQISHTVCWGEGRGGGRGIGGGMRDNNTYCRKGDTRR